MQIERVDHSSSQGVSGLKKQESLEEIVIPQEETSAPEETAVPAESEDSGGVLRLLEEGHFKGVADVRLRINFFEELQALDAQARIDASGGAFSTFNQSLQTDITALRDTGSLTAEQSAALDEFERQMQAMQTAYDGKTPLAEFIASLQTEFNKLTASLAPAPGDPVEESLPPEAPAVEEQAAPAEEVLEQTSEEAAQEPVEEILPAETSEEPNVFEQLVTNLQQNFQQTIEQLQSALDTPSTLPPLSEPSGNGKAYAKFLAIYEDMQNGSELPEETVESEPPIIEA